MLTDYAEFMGHSDLLNARYSIKPATAADPGAVYQDADWKVYENSRAVSASLARAYAIVEQDRKALLETIERSGNRSASELLWSRLLWRQKSCAFARDGERAAAV